MTTLHRERCNPYGYGSDRGPKHLMGGIFPASRAARDLVLEDGQHGIGVCERPADGWYVMRCPAGHAGPPMPLCIGHVAQIQRRMAQTCTACVMPPESRALWDDQERATAELHKAYAARDGRAVARLQARIEDIGRAQVELTRRGLTPRRPLRLEEVSGW